jgi:hypothetical protein
VLGSARRTQFLKIEQSRVFGSCLEIFNRALGRDPGFKLLGRAGQKVSHLDFMQLLGVVEWDSIVMPSPIISV